MVKVISMQRIKLFALHIHSPWQMESEEQESDITTFWREKSTVGAG